MEQNHEPNNKPLRHTSIEAYRYLVEEGGLAEAQRKVYEYLYNYGPTTQKKCERALGDTTYTMRPRFAQLMRMGLIKSVGIEPCPETGRKNMIWDVTQQAKPVITEKKITLKAKAASIAERLKKIELHTSDMFLKIDLRNLITDIEEYFL